MRCSVPDCGRAAKCRALCSMHYQRWRKSGRLHLVNNYARGGTPRLGANGYVYVWAPGHPLAMADGYVLEHRKVVYDAGIAIPPGYEVHHRNGVKTDNRVANLVVESPSGHQAHHSAPGTLRRNQFGAFPITDVNSGKRVCTRCGAEKPLTEFRVHHGRPYCWCGPCVRESARIKRALKGKEQHGN